MTLLCVCVSYGLVPSLSLSLGHLKIQNRNHIQCDRSDIPSETSDLKMNQQCTKMLFCYSCGFKRLRYFFSFFFNFYSPFFALGYGNVNMYVFIITTEFVV